MKGTFRSASLAVLILSAGSVALGQTSHDVPAQSQKVAAAVSGLKPARKLRLRVTLRSLKQHEGVLSSVGPDAMVIVHKERPRWDREITVPYKDILALSGPDVFISFVPDPARSPFGDWAAVRAIAQNESIGLVLSNGKQMYGRFGGAEPTRLTLLGATHDAIMNIPHDSVVRVYGLKKGRDGVGEYTRKGLKSGSEVGPPEALITTPVFAGIGALIGLSKQKGESLILVYSK